MTHSLLLTGTHVLTSDVGMVKFNPLDSVDLRRTDSLLDAFYCFSVNFLEPYKIYRSKNCVEERIKPKRFWVNDITVLTEAYVSYVIFYHICVVKRKEMERDWVSNITVFAASCPSYVTFCLERSRCCT